MADIKYLDEIVSFSEDDLTKANVKDLNLIKTDQKEWVYLDSYFIFQDFL